MLFFTLAANAYGPYDAQLVRVIDGGTIEVEPFGRGCFNELR